MKSEQRPADPDEAIEPMHAGGKSRLRTFLAIYAASVIVAVLVVLALRALIRAGLR